MNERIQQMIYNLNEKVGVHWTNEDKLKFSLLIVQECIDCLKPLSRNHSMVGAAQDTIKEHFGVEE